MTEIGLTSGLILTAIGVIGIWVKEYFNSRARRKNNNPHPCGKHGERLARLEEAVSDLKDDVKRIEGKVNGLR